MSITTIPALMFWVISPHSLFTSFEFLPNLLITLYKVNSLHENTVLRLEINFYLSLFRFQDDNSNSQVNSENK